MQGGKYMYRATRNIYDALRRDGNLKVFTEETAKYSDVWLQFGLKNGGSYRIRFISRDNDNDVAVRVFGFVSVEPRKISKILPVINTLNNKYRFVKFVCDDDGDVNVEYDFPISATRPEESATELVLRIANILDEAYPELMHVLWS